MSSKGKYRISTDVLYEDSKVKDFSIHLMAEVDGKMVEIIRFDTENHGNPNKGLHVHKFYKKDKPYIEHWGGDLHKAFNRLIKDVERRKHIHKRNYLFNKK